MEINYNNNNNNNNNNFILSLIYMLRTVLSFLFSLLVGSKEWVHGLETLSVPHGDSPVPGTSGCLTLSIFNDKLKYLM